MMPSKVSLAAAAGLAASLLVSSCGPARVQVPSPDTLSGQATIRRDTFGIPHITADTEEAAAFAFGYAQAEDHAAAIGRQMISGRGEEARYFGEGGLSNDEAMAQFDNLAAARRGLTLVSPLYRRIISAYAAGVNRYVEQHRAELPEWMPALTPEDVLANGRSGAASALAGPALARQLRQKYETTTGAQPDVGERGWHDEAQGSNAFALGGSRTVSGKPILLGNPHLSWSSLYWEAHVRVPGKIDFYGSTLAGIPVLRAGFNDRLAFVTTNNAPDLDDVYAFKVDTSGADRYLFDGRSMPLTRREATIAVRGADGGMRNEIRHYWDTHLGPVIYRNGTHVFSPKSTRLNAFRYFEGFYVMSKARNLDEWLAALRQNLVPTSNFTYADGDGNVLYQWNGQVPVRRDDGTDYRLDVRAESRADVWSTLHSVDDLPRLLNPPGGYVQNANNPPQFVSARDPLDMSPFPAYIERGPLALRPQLAIELLESKDKFSREDVIRLKYDTRMLLADRVKDELMTTVEASADRPGAGLAQEGARILAAWDNRVSAGSRGAVLFQRFWDVYSARTRQPFLQPWQASDPFRTPRGLDGGTAAVDALIQAVRETTQAHGSADVAWGTVNRFRFGDIDLPGDGAAGTYGTFRVLRFDQDPGGGGERVAGNVGGGRPLVGFGDAWVLLVDFAEGRATGWSVLAYGQTTNLGSPHSRDQIRIFASHDLRRAWYTDAEVRANTERTYRP